MKQTLNIRRQLAINYRYILLFSWKNHTKHVGERHASCKLQFAHHWCIYMNWQEWKLAPSQCMLQASSITLQKVEKPKYL